MGKRIEPLFMFGPDELADWWERGRCMGHPHADYWFADTLAAADETAYARAVCGTCPVKAECLSYAMSHLEVEGMWGGLTHKERRTVARGGRVQKAAPVPHLVPGEKFCGRGHDQAVHGRLYGSGEQKRLKCSECQRIGQNERRAWDRGRGIKRKDHLRKVA